MQVVNGNLILSDDEWHQLREMTGVVKRPTTPEEFNELCDDEARRIRLEQQYDPLCEVKASAIEFYKIGPDGKSAFPPDERKIEFVRINGYWPSDAELEAFESGGRVH